MQIRTAPGTIGAVARSGDVDWDDLRIFLAAVRAKTLAGAARALGVEHTTVGRRLTALERAVKAPLVLRGPEGLRLTPLGQHLAPLVAEVDRAVAAVTGAVTAQRLRVRLAVPSGLAGLFAPGLARLSREHPGLSIELAGASRPVDLEAGEADLAVRDGAISDADLIARKLCDTGFALYASADYLARRPAPIDPEDLRGHDVIAFHSGLARAPAARWLEGRLGGASVVLRGREMTEILAAAKSGAGLAVLPCFMGDDERSLERVTPGVVTTSKLSLVYRRESRSSEGVRVVARFVCDVIAQHADRIGGRAAAGRGRR